MLAIFLAHRNESLKGIYKKEAIGIWKKETRERFSKSPKCQINYKITKYSPIKNILAKCKLNSLIADSLDLSLYSDKNQSYIWILNFIDSHTKFVWSFSLIKNTWKNTVKFFFQIFKWRHQRILHGDTEKNANFKHEWIMCKV